MRTARAFAFLCGIAIEIGLVVSPHTAMAADVAVSTSTALGDAIANAKPGDTIVLADGTYESTGFSCQKAGTEAMPITVRAANPHGAIVRFDALEGFKIAGDHWHFDGLVVQGVCAADSDCEHAFHVNGARGFVLRNSRVSDFNAQLKVNAVVTGSTQAIPHGGLVERNELFDTHARATSQPTTKLNIDSGDDWVVRDNFVHDFQKGAGDNVSYGVFLKCGGQRGIVERNLVLCARDFSGGARIGLSLGGGGCAPQFCQPSFDANVACVEHHDGIVRNNIVANCSDTGIYINASAQSGVWFNTVIGAGPIDFRFAATTGQAGGNLTSGAIRNRDGATATFSSNLDGVALATFSDWYTDPLRGDLSQKGDWSAVIGQGPTTNAVTDDYCGRSRSTPFDVGALQHSLGDCQTATPPPPQDLASAAPSDLAGADLTGADLAHASDASTTTTTKTGGCSCRIGHDAPEAALGGWAVLCALVVATRWAARRRTRSPRDPS